MRLHHLMCVCAPVSRASMQRIHARLVGDVMRHSWIVLILSCAHPSPRLDTPSEACGRAPLAAVFERTTCYGPCPVYRTVVCRDGVVVFDGKRNVAHPGRHIRRLDAHALQLIGELLDSAAEGPSPLEEPLRGDAQAVRLADWRAGTARWLTPTGVAEKFETLVGTSAWVKATR